MKKLYTIMITLLLVIVTVGCSQKENTQNQSTDDNKLKVYATIFPIYDFTRNIGGDKIDLNYIVPPSGEPHDFEISAKTMKNIQDSNLLIKNGLGVDSFADSISEESATLKIVDASEGITPLKYHEEEGHDESEEEHSHGEYDPHIWLNINNAIKECENIKNALVKADEENKDYYEENYNNYVEKLKALDKSYEDTLGTLKGNTLLVSHEAYGYLCKQYGLSQVSITGISPNQEPSISKIASLTEFAKENNVKYVLFDGLVNPKVANTIASEAKINTEVLYSIDGITKEDFNNNEGYISLMEKNLETLKLVLK